MMANLRKNIKSCKKLPWYKMYILLCRNKLKSISKELTYYARAYLTVNETDSVMDPEI